jgi:hypothetical protein
MGVQLDGRIILSWIFRNWVMGAKTGSSWLKIGTGGGTCECGNEPAGPVKCGEFLDWLRTTEFLKKEAAP